MRLTNGEPDQRVYEETLKKILNCRLKTFKDDSYKLNIEQEKLLKDTFCAEDMKDTKELFKDTLKEYVDDGTKDIYGTYKTITNRAQALKIISDIAIQVKKEKPGIEMSTIISSLFQKILDKGQKMPKIPGMTDQQQQSIEDKLINDACQYLNSVFLGDNKEEDLDMQEIFEDGEGKEPKQDNEEAMKYLKRVLENDKSISIPKDALEKCLQIASKLKMIIKNQKIDKEKYTKSDTFDNELDIDTLKNIGELSSILPHQFVFDDIGLLELKAYNQELLKKQNMSKHKRKRIIYMLLDVSGSMHGLEKTCIALVSAIMSFCIDKKDIFYFETFNYKIRSSFTAKNKNDMKAIIKSLASSSFGDNTAIQMALSHAIKNIKDKKAVDGVDLKDAEIFLITDGDDSVNTEIINKDKEDIRIHTTLLNSGGESDLKKISTTFNHVCGKDGDFIDKGKAIDLVSVF